VNKVEINIPEGPGDDRPHPNAPILKVSLTFYARVEGAVHVDESELYKEEG
jgi:hypothetical protein